MGLFPQGAQLTHSGPCWNMYKKHDIQVSVKALVKYIYFLQCFGWSWYLANDMQFYVISPLMLIPLHFAPKIGSIVCFIFLLITLITAGVISSANHMGASLISAMTQTTQDPNNFMSYFFDYYIVPWCIMAPYIVGIYTGYVLNKCKCKFYINKVSRLIVCWEQIITMLAENHWENSTLVYNIFLQYSLIYWFIIERKCRPYDHKSNNKNLK